jgi:hypothetical protein
MHGVSGVGSYQYLLQLRQSQGPNSNANSSALQSANQGQPQGTKSTAQGGSVAFLLGLFRNTGGNSSTSAARTTGTSTSKQSTAAEDLSDTDTSDDGSVRRHGVKGALSGLHRHSQGGTRASTLSGSSMSEDEPSAKSHTNGGGSTPQSGTTSSRGGSAASQMTGTSGIASYRQRAIAKYLQLSPAGGGGAGLSSISTTA